jgi:hypothetical protein
MSVKCSYMSEGLPKCKSVYAVLCFGLGIILLVGLLAYQVVPRPDREVIARLRNCILALANCKMMLYDTSILYAFEESQKYQVSYYCHYNNHSEFIITLHKCYRLSCVLTVL